jgi:hypothetical protein
VPQSFRNRVNLARVGQALNSQANVLIWLGVPATLLVSTVVLEFGIFPNLQRWHFYANLAISSVLILYVALHTRTSKVNRRLLRWGLLFQIFIIGLNLIQVIGDQPSNQWARQVTLWFSENPQSRYPIGFVDGLAAAYVFVLGFRSPNVRMADSSKQEGLRSLVTITGFLTAIVALSTLSAQAPYEVGYAIRPALLSSGLLVSVLCVSLGGIIGRTNNLLLPYLGIVAMFALGLILGVGVVPLGGGGGFIIMSLITFWTNVLLLTGVISVLIVDPKCYLHALAQKLSGAMRRSRA